MNHLRPFISHSFRRRLSRRFERDLESPFRLQGVWFFYVGLRQAQVVIEEYI